MPTGDANYSPQTIGTAGLGHRPVFLLVVLTLGGWLAGAVWPRLLVMLGIYDYGMIYLDSYAVLAALDAVRAGADPHAANPLDPLMRNHVYSDWWLALRWLGLARSDNFAAGTVMAGAFGVAAWGTLRPVSLAGAGWLAVLMVSPAIQLAVNRANNDLVIFVILAICGVTATAPAWRGRLTALACLGLATGLKYFPAPAALAFLWMRPVRRMPPMLLGALLVVGLAMASVWPQVDRSRFTVGSGVHTMGAPLLWRDLGWKDTQSALPGIVLLAVAAVALARSGATTGLAVRGGMRERMLAVIGATVLLACFLVGVNYSYRWIFVLWPAAWLWREAGSDSGAPRISRLLAAAGCVLITLGLWLDGLFCVAVNLAQQGMTQGELDRLQCVWRLWTQPLQWLLMAMLAGWLLEGLLATAREWWAERHAQ